MPKVIACLTLASEDSSVTHLINVKSKTKIMDTTRMGAIQSMIKINPRCRDFMRMFLTKHHWAIFGYTVCTMKGVRNAAMAKKEPHRNAIAWKTISDISRTITPPKWERQSQH
jgi:hypothetical protein